jgi:integrase
MSPQDLPSNDERAPCAASPDRVTLSKWVNERFPPWEQLLSAHDVARLTRRPRWVLLGLMLLGRFRPIEQRPLDMDVLKPEEIAALREAARPATYRDGKLATNNYRLLISFAVFTGCRVGEILGAAWSHIDWESGQFHVRRTFREGRFQEPKTRTSYRRLSLPTFLLKEM